MPHTTQTFKIWKSTLKKLRMLYAITGDSMVSIVDQLVTEKLERLNNLPQPFELAGSPLSRADMKKFREAYDQQPPPNIQYIAMSPCDPIQVAEATGDIKFGCDLVGYPIVNYP